MLSEKDTGLYDAMNKGIKLATSEYIIFMNAGDTFFDENTLKNIFENDKISVKNADIFYGDAQMISENAGENTNEIIKAYIPAKKVRRDIEDDDEDNEE